MAIIDFTPADLAGFYEFRASLDHQIDELVSQDSQKRTVYDYGAQGWRFRCKWRYFEVEHYHRFIGRIMGYGRAAQFRLPLGCFHRAWPTVAGQGYPAHSAISWVPTGDVVAGQSRIQISPPANNPGILTFPDGRNLNAEEARVAAAQMRAEMVPGAWIQIGNHEKIYTVQTVQISYIVISPSAWTDILFIPEDLVTIKVGGDVAPVVRFDRASPGFRRAVDGWFTADLRFVEDATPTAP